MRYFEEDAESGGGRSFHDAGSGFKDGKKGAEKNAGKIFLSSLHIFCPEKEE